MTANKLNFNLEITDKIVITYFMYICYLGLLGHDRMVVGFTTTYAISAYHH